MGNTNSAENDAAAAASPDGVVSIIPGNRSASSSSSSSSAAVGRSFQPHLVLGFLTKEEAQLASNEVLEQKYNDKLDQCDGDEAKEDHVDRAYHAIKRKRASPTVQKLHDWIVDFTPESSALAATIVVAVGSVSLLLLLVGIATRFDCADACVRSVNCDGGGGGGGGSSSTSTSNSSSSIVANLSQIRISACQDGCAFGDNWAELLCGLLLAGAFILLAVLLIIFVSVFEYCNCCTDKCNHLLSGLPPLGRLFFVLAAGLLTTTSVFVWLKLGVHDAGSVGYRFARWLASWQWSHVFIFSYASYFLLFIAFLIHQRFELASSELAANVITGKTRFVALALNFISAIAPLVFLIFLGAATDMSHRNRWDAIWIFLPLAGFFFLRCAYAMMIPIANCLSQGVGSLREVLWTFVLVAVFYAIPLAGCFTTAMSLNRDHTACDSKWRWSLALIPFDVSVVMVLIWSGSILFQWFVKKDKKKATEWFELCTLDWSALMRRAKEAGGGSGVGSPEMPGQSEVPFMAGSGGAREMELSNPNAHAAAEATAAGENEA